MFKRKLECGPSSGSIFCFVRKQSCINRYSLFSSHFIFHLDNFEVQERDKFIMMREIHIYTIRVPVQVAVGHSFVYVWCVCVSCRMKWRSDEDWKKYENNCVHAIVDFGRPPRQTLHFSSLLSIQTNYTANGRHRWMFFHVWVINTDSKVRAPLAVKSISVEKNVCSFLYDDCTWLFASIQQWSSDSIILLCTQ